MKNLQASPHRSPVIAAPDAERLPVRTHVAYGSSAFAENIAINSLNQIANPVFNLALGVSPVLVGTALALPRVLDVFLDPWIGGLSDNCQSRWGRRRPFILFGALVTALCFAAIWFFPLGRSPTFYFAWLSAGSLLLAAAYSIFVVPYGALGMELTRDHHERTRLMGTKSMLHKMSGVVNQWLLRLVLWAGNSNLIAGSRIGGVLLACVVATLGAVTATQVPEPKRATTVAPRLPIWQAWRQTMRHGDFLRLLAAQILITASMVVIDTTGFYLNVFHVNDGDMAAGALMKGVAGTCFHLCGLLAVPGIVWLSGRLGKKNALLLCTGTLVLAGISKWFCYVPGAGWLMVVPSILLAPGMVALMVLVPSMTADICDIDELSSGARREGMFNAVLGWTIKVALSGSIFLSGIVLDLTGWQTDLLASQHESTFLAMRITFCAGTVVFALVAALVIAGCKSPCFLRGRSAGVAARR